MRSRSVLTVFALAFASLSMASTNVVVYKGGEQTGTKKVEDGNSLMFSPEKLWLSDEGGNDLQTWAMSDSVKFKHTVDIHFDGDKVTCHNPYDSVYVTIDGTRVEINSQTLRHEVDFYLSGNSDDGSVYINTVKKIELHLNGIQLKSQSENAPIYIASKKNTKVVLEDDTKNHLEDTDADTTGAVFRSRGQLEFKGGNGSLTITSPSSHGIQSREYVEWWNGGGFFEVGGDGFHVNDYYIQNGGDVKIYSHSDGVDVGEGYFEMNGGYLEVNLSESNTKGIKVEIDPAAETPEMGNVLVSGGKIEIYDNKNGGCRGFKLDRNYTQTGGEVVVMMSGESVYDVDKADYVWTCALKADGAVTVQDGELNIICKSTAKSSRCIQADGNISLIGGQTVVHQNSEKMVKPSEAPADAKPKKPSCIKTDGQLTIGSSSNLYISYDPDLAKGFNLGDITDVVYGKEKVIFIDEEDKSSDVLIISDEFNTVPLGWKYTQFSN